MSILNRSVVEPRPSSRVKFSIHASCSASVPVVIPPMKNNPNMWYQGPILSFSCGSPTCRRLGSFAVSDAGLIRIHLLTLPGAAGSQPISACALSRSA